MKQSKILLELIYNRTGIYIANKNDCKKLSMLISEQKIGYLSESTLYRFFLHPTSSSKPYKNTLNILAQFCGFNSWHHFMYFTHTNQLHNDGKFLSSTLHVIIEDMIKKENFSALMALISSVEKEEYKTKEYIGLLIIKGFQKTTNFDLFMQHYGDHLFVRAILIEALFDPIYRIPKYAEGLHYYIQYTNKTSALYEQDLLFGYAVLYRYYYLAKNEEHKQIGAKLYNSSLSQIDLSTVHLFPRSRFYAYKIWFLHSNDTNSTVLNDYLNEVFVWITEEFKSVQSLISLNIIYQTIVEVLDDLDLYDDKAVLESLYSHELKKFKPKVNEYELFHNANGILNLLQ
jgi:hypothetical protein